MLFFFLISDIPCVPPSFSFTAQAQDAVPSCDEAAGLPPAILRSFSRIELLASVGDPSSLAEVFLLFPGGQVILPFVALHVP